MTDPIPAIREADATGETAALFADLRTTLDVSFVNLIWRHLATMPGMLAWTWSVVKPMHAMPALHQAAKALRAGVTVPDGIRQPIAVFDAAGVMLEDRRNIHAMLHDYGTANAVNLLSLLLVQAVLAGDVPGGQPASDAVREQLVSAPPRHLPALPGLAELSPSLRSLVLDLDRFGRTETTDAVASLYRHLAHWPGFLAVAHAALSIPHQTGLLRLEHERTRAHATVLMRDRLLPFTAVPSAPPASGRADAQAGIQIFTGQMIARMVAMGEVMLGLMPIEPRGTGQNEPVPHG